MRFDTGKQTEINRCSEMRVTPPISDVTWNTMKHCLNMKNTLIETEFTSRMIGNIDPLSERKKFHVIGKLRMNPASK